MSTPAKGHADYLDLGTWNAACAECGRKFKANEMRKLPPGVPGGGMCVCRPHWNARQPQDFVRGVPDRMAAPWVQPQSDTYADMQEVLTNDAETDLQDSANWLQADTGEVLTS